MNGQNVLGISKKKGLRNKLTKFFAKYKYPIPNPEYFRDEGLIDTEHGEETPEARYYRNEMKRTKETTRLAIYRDVREIEREFPEASSALDAHADSATMSEEGDVIAGDDFFKSPDSELEELWKGFDDRTHITSMAWPTARDSRHMGDYFNENVINSAGLVVKIKSLLPESIEVCADSVGEFKSPAYVQKRPGTDITVATFESWEITHIKNDPLSYSLYGRSLLLSGRRTYKHIQMMEESAVIRRLTRATDRYGFEIEGGRMTPQRAKEYIRILRQENKTRKQYDRSGKGSLTYNPIGMQEDLYMILRDGKGGVKVLSGPTSMDMTDIIYFQRKFNTSLKTPVAFIGLDESTRGKSVIMEEAVQFSKSIRRLQGQMAWWMRTIFGFQYLLLKNELLPDSAYSLNFPPVSSKDEMVRWQIEETKAKIASIYRVEIGCVDDYWVLTEILGYSKERAIEIIQRTSGEIEIEEGLIGYSEGRNRLPTAKEIRRHKAIAGMVNNFEDVFIYSEPASL